MPQDTIREAIRDLWDTILLKSPDISGRRKVALDLLITVGGGLGAGLLSTLFPQRTLQTLRQAFGFSVSALTSNLLIVSLLLLVLYNQRRMRQSNEERQPAVETDGGTSSGDPVAFFVGATIGALIGSQYLEGAILVMAIIGSGFILYEYERSRL